MAGEAPAFLQDKAGLPKCQKVKRQPLALQFATGAHPAVLTCIHTQRTHGHAHGTRACTRHTGTHGGGRCPQAMRGALCAAGASQQLVAGPAPVEEEASVALEALGERRGQTAASEKGRGPLDAGSNRTLLRGDRGGDSLCGGPGGRVRWGGDVIVYTSGGFALFFWQEQVHSDGTWTSRTQADSGLPWLHWTGWLRQAWAAVRPQPASKGPRARPPVPRLAGGPLLGQGPLAVEGVHPGGDGCSPWGGVVAQQYFRPGACVQPPCRPRRGCQATCESLPGLGAL